MDYSEYPDQGAWLLILGIPFLMLIANLIYSTFLTLHNEYKKWRRGKQKIYNAQDTRF